MMRFLWRRLSVGFLIAFMVFTLTAGGLRQASAENAVETAGIPEETAAESVSIPEKTAADPTCFPEENRLIVRTDSDITDAVDPSASMELEGGYILSFDSQQDCQAAAGILAGMDSVESAESDAVIGICTDPDVLQEESAPAETDPEPAIPPASEETDMRRETGPETGAETSAETDAGFSETDSAEAASSETEEMDKERENAAETGQETEGTGMAESDSDGQRPEKEKGFLRPDQWREQADRQGKSLVVLIDTGADDADIQADLTGEGIGDTNGHGSQMNRLIMQASGGKAFVVSLKALDGSGTGLVSNLYSAVSYAMQSQADVISLCVSAKDAGQMEGFRSLLRDAAEKGICVVCAAGNNGLEAEMYCPGNVEEVLTIGACDSQGAIRPHSNYGKAIDCFCSAGSTSEAAALVSGYVCLYGADGLGEASQVFMPDEVTDPLAWEAGYTEDDGLFHISADTIKAGSSVKLNGGYNVGPAVSASGSDYLAEYTFRINGNTGFCGNIAASRGMYASASGTRNYVCGVYDFTDVGGKDVDYIVQQVYDKNKDYSYGGRTIDGTLIRKILYYSDGAPGASKFGWESFEKGYAENSYVFSDLPGANRDSDPNRSKYTGSNAYRMGVVSCACSYIWGQEMGLCTVNEDSSYKTYVIGKRYVDKIRSLPTAPESFTAYFAVISDSYGLDTSMSVVQPVLSWVYRDTIQLRIRKIVAADSSMIRPSGYDMSKYYSPKGLVFGIYSDKACTKLAAKVTIGAADANGNYYSGWTELSQGTYYLKEIDNAANKNIKISKITSEFQAEVNDSLYPDGKRTIDVTDSPVTGGLQVRKLVKDSRGADVGKYYSAEGVKFALYTAASGGTKLADLTIGKRSADGGYYSNTVKEIAYGTYYLQEVSIPKTLQDAGVTMLKDRIKCEVIPGKVNSSGILILDAENQVEDPEIKTSAADVRTGSQDSLSVKEVSITDHVSYERLAPGHEYVLTGILMDREKKEAVKVNGKEITGQTTFTPEKAAGTADVTFSFDGSGLCGRKLCVFEELFLDGKKVAEHKDYKDQKQQIDMSEPGQISLVKYDSSGKELPGVIFEITDEQGRPVRDLNGNILEDKTAAEDGSVAFTDLPYGKYRITEIKTQAGYSLLAKPLDVTLPAVYTEEEAEKEQIDTSHAFYSQKEGKYYITDLRYKVSDSITLQMPRAGKSRYYAGIPGLILIGAGGLWMIRKRKSGM